MNAAKFQNSSKYEIYGFDVGYYSAGDLKVIFKCEPKYPPAKIGIFSNMAWYDAVEDFVQIVQGQIKRQTNKGNQRRK